MVGGPNRWWGVAERGDTGRVEAFSDGVFAIAITLLILEVRVEQSPEESLAAALHHALPEIGAFIASFLQIGIMWANHTALKLGAMWGCMPRYERCDDDSVTICCWRILAWSGGGLALKG